MRVAQVGFAIAALIAVAWPGKAQTIWNPPDRQKFNAVFDGLKGERLKCNARTMDPRVDFAFRFELRYWVECEIRQFGGDADELKVFVRVRLDEGVETLFGDRLTVPAAPRLMDDSGLKRTHAILHFSGALAAGIGTYRLELLLVDKRNRIYRQHWTARAYPRGHERDLNFSMPPNKLAALSPIPIPDRNGPKGRTLTVLLNAAPLNPRSNKLRAWDRAFLLDSLSSLLRQVSYPQVRVVAFNLEQQREFFRRGDFGEGDMPKLAEALRKLELGSIEYSKLERKQGWAELLIGLLNDEAQAEDRPDALVILGPTIRLADKAPGELLTSAKTASLPLFCVAYYPWIGADFPDSVQYVTNAFGGKVYRIHSPSELAQNLEKLKREMSSAGDAAARTIRDAK